MNSSVVWPRRIRKSSQRGMTFDALRRSRPVQWPRHLSLDVSQLSHACQDVVAGAERHVIVKSSATDGCPVAHDTAGTRM
jgi:hypothetical protein